MDHYMAPWHAHAHTHTYTHIPVRVGARASVGVTGVLTCAQACLLLLARFAIAEEVLGAEWLLRSLAQLDGAEGAATGGAAPAVLRQWVGLQDDILRPGAAAATLLGLIRLISLPRPELHTLPVAAVQAVNTAAPRASRSRASSRGGKAAAAAAEVALLVRVFQLVIQGMVRHEQAAAAAEGRAASKGWGEEEDDEDEDDDGDDEEDEDEGDEGEESGGAEAMARAGGRGAASPFLPAERAHELVNVSDLLDDGDEDEARDEATDAAALPDGAAQLVHALAAHLGGQFEQLVAQAGLGADGRRVVAAVFAT